MYQHTQTGWTVIISLLVSLLILGFISLPGDGIILFSSISLFIIFFGILFNSLTVQVDEKNIRWYFGPGFWRKELSFENIEKVSEASNQWYYGWGIRKIPNGWLYNVSGLAAIEIKLKDGKVIRVGTDEPDVLKRAIQSRLHLMSHT